MPLLQINFQSLPQNDRLACPVSLFHISIILIGVPSLMGSSAMRTYRNRILDFAETGVLWALGSLSPVVSLPPRVTVVVLEGCAVTSHIDERGMVSSR